MIDSVRPENIQVLGSLITIEYWFCYQFYVHPENEYLKRLPLGLLVGFFTASLQD
jgi:hypothetical protein